MDIKRLIRVGTVSSINAAAGTVRVAFAAQDDMVTYELPVITRGSKNNKDYWLPDVDEQVLCLFLPNTSGRGVCDGFVLGTFYSSIDAPVENSGDVHAVKYGDGTIIKHDRSTGKLTINATGDIDIIAGGKITINGQTIYLN
jgi:phage baseplate assembly protein V|nr:MAG TPA: baseplate assembly protein [Caudoviricetes sp.]